MLFLKLEVPAGYLCASCHAEECQCATGSFGAGGKFAIIVCYTGHLTEWSAPVRKARVLRKICSSE